MRDCAKGVFDGWSLTPEFYALPVDGIAMDRLVDKICQTQEPAMES